MSPLAVSTPCLYTDAAPTDIYTLSLHDALPISTLLKTDEAQPLHGAQVSRRNPEHRFPFVIRPREIAPVDRHARHEIVDRKSTRLNSSHVSISYAVFCLKKKKKAKTTYNIFCSV